ncbi:hypothetical protein [Loktanella sp. S4079]|uniref:hypothetical protein n=1 Tax=Loktanella sp. S4079 TaxID=579483 RepID=UPI0005F9C33F|nr:hypothetical protein [Loktanella sp. S4079]KJZ21141.1 hypothetical protein TW80_00320 [Loktanella sp. S4079]
MRELLNLLEAEATAIRNGEFSNLDEMRTRKETLFDAFKVGNPTEKEVENLRATILRNQSLFEAALSGIRAARSRIAALQNVRSGLSTYDQSGALSRVEIHHPQIEKKA